MIIATAVSQMTGIPMIVVRKKPKQYGAFADEYVEGPFEAGQRVLLLEDVVTSGREVLAARARLEELNLKVDVYAIVSRGLAPINCLLTVLAAARRSEDRQLGRALRARLRVNVRSPMGTGYPTLMTLWSSATTISPV